MSPPVMRRDSRSMHRLRTTTGNKPIRIQAERVPVPTFYSRPDTRLYPAKLARGVARLRKRGATGMLYKYYPAEWWDTLYKMSPAQYYKQRYTESTGVFCTVCENRGAPFTCAGWDATDLREVTEKNRQTWVCPRCRRAGRTLNGL